MLRYEKNDKVTFSDASETRTHVGIGIGKILQTQSCVFIAKKYVTLLYALYCTHVPFAMMHWCDY